MRVAARALILLSGLACVWFLAVGTTLIVPDGPGSALADAHYEGSAARFSLLPALLALANGAGALRVHRRPRPGALWVVLLAGGLALAWAVWHYLSLHAPWVRWAPDFYVDRKAIAALQRDQFFRWYLACAALALTLIGWAAWRVNQRIRLNLDRG